jgi:hypothetical protein
VRSRSLPSLRLTAHQFALINLYFFQIVKERTANDLFKKSNLTPLVRFAHHSVQV